MTHYFTREEAEQLLPAISIILRRIQSSRQCMRELDNELLMLREQAIGNGHHLHERIVRVQQNVARHIQELQDASRELRTFGCELKDPDKGLIDFPSLRAGQEIYLCWSLEEERILFWHYLHTGLAGRQPLDD